MAKKGTSIPGWPPERSSNSGDAFGEALLRANPLTAGFAGGLDFMKSLWGGLPSTVPGFVVPTVDLEELDKRLTDLKAVEAWLALNANMLRTTIQSLEVQRNTIAALNSFGGNLNQSTEQMLHGMQKHAAGAEKVAPAASAAESAAAEPRAATSGHGAPKTANRKGGKAGTGGSGATPGAAPAAGTAWLDFLQSQFNQVASAALAGGGVAAPAKKAAPRKTPKAAARSRPKAL